MVKLLMLFSFLQQWSALVDMPKMEWKESVNLVFDYFCERTPRSFVEARDTSVVWNYKYAGELSKLWHEQLPACLLLKQDLG